MIVPNSPSFIPQWYSHGPPMVPHGPPWSPMVPHGPPWSPMVPHGLIPPIVPSVSPMIKHIYKLQYHIPRSMYQYTQLVITTYKTEPIVAKR